MTTAAARGITPASASAPANAASASSIAWSHARSDVVAATASDTKMGANSPVARSSEGKERRLLRTLQVDVEPVLAGFVGRRHGDKARPDPGVVDRREHGIRGVG